MGRRPHTEEEKALRGKVTIEGRVYDIEEIKRAARVVNKNFSTYLLAAGKRKAQRDLKMRKREAGEFKTKEKD